MGTYEVIIDDKNRVMIPSKWREHFISEMSVILSKGFDGCVDMRNITKFEELTGKIRNIPDFSERRRTFQRIIIGSSKEIKLDKWFRFVVPSSFGDYKGEVTLVGVGDNVEIWKREEYEEWVISKGSFLKDNKLEVN